MISRGGYFATKQKFVLSILLFKSRVKWILDSCWKWGDNYYNQHKSEHLENECKIKPRKQLKKKNKSLEWMKSDLCKCISELKQIFFLFPQWPEHEQHHWASSIRIQKLPLSRRTVSTCPPSPPVNDVFILYSVDMRAGLYDTHLGILACTVKCTEHALPLSWGR